MGDNENYLELYGFMARLPLPKSYIGKILLAAFIGTHVPLLALLVFFVFAAPIAIQDVLHILAVVLIATLAGAAGTLYALLALLRLVSLASSALRRYLDYNEVPDLSTGFSDKAGKLMADLQYTVEHLDKSLRSLEELSTKDYLTGAYNRRGCEELLVADLARARRSGEDELSIALIDMDQFKRVNDQYGHQVGDLCLRHVATLIRRNIREGDWLARWGGDEFVLVLRETEERRLPETVFERINEDLARNPGLLPQGEEIGLTLSRAESIALSAGAKRRSKRSSLKQTKPSTERKKKESACSSPGKG